MHAPAAAYLPGLVVEPEPLAPLSVPDAPELPDDAAGAEEDDDLRAFLCFLAFFFLGWSVVAVSAPAPPALLEAAG